MKVYLINAQYNNIPSYTRNIRVISALNLIVRIFVLLISSKKLEKTFIIEVQKHFKLILYVFNIFGCQ